jgi:hypothetical protein
MMKSVGTFLIGLGIVLILMGFLLRQGVRWNWLGRLPGDIIIRKGNFTLYFPIATSILLSLVLSLVLFLIVRLIGKN